MQDLKEYVKINKYGNAEITLDTSDLQIYGSEDNIEDMEVVYTDYTFSVNQNKVYQQAHMMCQRDKQCTGDEYDSDEKIQSAMFKVIWENTTATYDEMKETHDKLYNASNNETNKDTLYEMYHEFFTRTKSITNTPRATDYLTVATCATPATCTYNVKSGGANVLRKDFKSTLTVPLYCGKVATAMAKYMRFYAIAQGGLKTAMENFQWDLVVYDEVEEFPEMINHPNFTKPFSERKQRLNYWRPSTVVQKQAV